MQLGEIDFLTKLKWSVGVLVPGVAKREVGVYLYPLPNAKLATEISNLPKEYVDYVGFFLVCKTNETYLARPASLAGIKAEVQSMKSSATAEDDHKLLDNHKLFLGTTASLAGIKAEGTRKGKFISQ